MPVAKQNCCGFSNCCCSISIVFSGERKKEKVSRQQEKLKQMEDELKDWQKNLKVYQEEVREEFKLKRWKLGEVLLKEILRFQLR